MRQIPKRILSSAFMSFFVLLCLVLPMKAEAAEVASGSCGENLTWTLDDEGTLTISGSGEMEDYDSNTYNQPWYQYQRQIVAVIFDDTVTKIGSDAFQYCSNLEKVDMPDQLLQLGASCFEACYKLKTLEIPASLTHWGDCAVRSGGIEHLRFLGKAPVFGEEPFDNQFKTINYPSDDSSWEPYAQAQLGGSNVNWVPTVPGSVANGRSGLKAYWNLSPEGVLTISPVDSSGYMTSYSNPSNVPWEVYREQITAVVIAEGITNIGGNAFYGCSSLQRIEIPESVASVRDFAFGCCYELRELTFTGSPPDFERDSLSGLTATVYYPGNDSSWTAVGTGVVGNSYGGTIIWEAVYPTEGTCGENISWRFAAESGKLTISGNGAMTDYFFSGADAPWIVHAEKIREIVITDNITHIGDNTFFDPRFRQVQSVTLPEGLQSIGAGSFNCCTKLAEIMIPANVETIGSSAFNSCLKLKTITFTGSAPAIAENAFSGVTAAAYYPAGDITWESAKLNYGGTITWVPYCPGGHQYDKPVFTWHGNASCTAESSCNACGDSQSVSCTLTTVTVPATEQREGSVTYTATALLNGTKYTDTKVEIIPKKEHIHSFSENWASNGDHHWKLCSVCGERKDISSHTPGSEATENSSQKCSICGHVLRTPLGLDWFFEKLEEPDNYLWASGYCAKIMEQYG